MHPIYFLLEEGDVFYAGRVVALVRQDRETVIVTEGNDVATSAYTPRTIGRRSREFWTRCEWHGRSN